MQNIIQDHKKILIIKLSAIGDVIHTLPCLDALKTKLPNSSITWLIEKKALGVIQYNSDIDNIIVFKRNIFSLINVLREIKQQNFDYAIDFQGTYKSQLFCKFSNAPFRIGYNKTKESLPFAYNTHVTLSTMNKHAVDRNLQLLSPFNISKPDNIRFNLSILEESKQKITNLLAQKRINKYCIITPFAGNLANRWEPEKFAKLADLLADNLNINVVFIGTKKESKINKQIIAQTKSKKIFNFAGKMSFNEFAYFTSKAKFIVCGDTGPMHVAAAVDCPIFALFGPTNPLRTGPFQGKNYIISKNISCSPCYKRKCKDKICLNTITPKEVFEVCEKFILNSANSKNHY